MISLWTFATSVEGLCVYLDHISIQFSVYVLCVLCALCTFFVYKMCARLYCTRASIVLLSKCCFRDYINVHVHVYCMYIRIVGSVIFYALIGLRISELEGVWLFHMLSFGFNFMNSTYLGLVAQLE